jgi:hypothetical protein
MPKSKYAHLVHDGDVVVYLAGCSPMYFQFSPQREEAKKQEAQRIRALGFKPFRVAGTDITRPQARREIYSLPPGGSVGEHW